MTSAQPTLHAGVEPENSLPLLVLCPPSSKQSMWKRLACWLRNEAGTCLLVRSQRGHTSSNKCLLRAVIPSWHQPSRLPPPRSSYKQSIRRRRMLRMPMLRAAAVRALFEIRSFRSESKRITQMERMAASGVRLVLLCLACSACGAAWPSERLEWR